MVYRSSFPQHEICHPKKNYDNVLEKYKKIIYKV